MTRTTSTYKAPAPGVETAGAYEQGRAAGPAQAEGGSSILNMQFGGRVTLKDVLTLTRQLSVMIRAGISITEALESMADQTPNPKLRKLLIELHGDVEAGKPFSEAIEAHPKVFSQLYINMIRASELSGSFSHILSRLATYLTQQIETRSQVRAAMMYPAIIGCMALGTTVFMLTYVLPKFLDLFAGKEALLPLPTKMLLGLSSSMTHYWYVYLVTVVGVVTGLILFIRTETGRFAFDTVKLRVPIFKKLFHCLYLSRSLRTMGELVNAGVPMLETINVTGKVAGNVHYHDLWDQVRDAVGEGKTISVTLLRSNLMPRGVTQMISAGEQSGNLAEVLGEVSSFYDSELKTVIKSSTAMLEPMMIVGMGGLVGFVAASILLPIFTLSKIMK